LLSKKKRKEIVFLFSTALKAFGDARSGKKARNKDEEIMEYLTQFSSKEHFYGIVARLFRLFYK